jgi:hypothetical protein
MNDIIKLSSYYKLVNNYIERVITPVWQPDDSGLFNFPFHLTSNVREIYPS